MNDSVIAANREQIAVVGENHWAVTGRLYVALGDGPQLPDQRSCFS